MDRDLLDRLNPRVLAGSTPEHPRIKIHRLNEAERRSYPEGIVDGPIPEFLRACVDQYFQREGTFQARRTSLDWGRKTLLMGVLNVTPDSFSDGGRFLQPSAAIERGLQMAQQGADMIDIGGESTRPGAPSIPAEEQIRRTVPVIRDLAAKGLLISIDTASAQVARAALEAGASIVNDITGLGGDPQMIDVVRDSGAAVVIMHIQGTPRTMQASPHYDDVMEEITRTLRSATNRAMDAGISRNRIVIDPGLGFGKRFEDNIEIVQRVAEFRTLGFPVLIGASRKSFIGTLMGEPKPDERLNGSLAVAAYVAANGARIVRAHDVKETRDVLAIIDRVRPE